MLKHIVRRCKRSEVKLAARTDFANQQIMFANIQGRPTSDIRQEEQWRRRLRALNGTITAFSAGNPTKIVKSMMKNDEVE